MDATNKWLTALLAIGAAAVCGAVPASGGPRAGETRTIALPGGVRMELAWCPPGTFSMGSPEDEEGRTEGLTGDDGGVDETRHRVRLTQGFWMGKTEVTQGQWRSVMGTTVVDLAKKALQDDTAHGMGMTIRDLWGLPRGFDPAVLAGEMDDELPVIFVDKDTVDSFCYKLTAFGHHAGWLPGGCTFRLPTEAQWEYACRAGTGTTLPNGGDFHIEGEFDAPALDGIAWYGGNSSVGRTGGGIDTADWPGKQYPGGGAWTRRVGQKEPNRWGLRDMLGNVSEWCEDWCGTYPEGTVTDPTGVKTGSERIIRGGNWRSPARWCRPARRDGLWPFMCDMDVGFRVVCTGEWPSGEDGSETAGPAHSGSGRMGLSKSAVDFSGYDE